MTFRYKYIPPEQLESDTKKSGPVILADGDGKFTILNVLDTDKDGGQRMCSDGKTPKVTLKLSCVDCRGDSGVVFQDISANMQWAILQLGTAIGRNLYNETGITYWNNLIGLSGNCVFKTVTNPPYKPQTRIARYLPLSKDQAAHWANSPDNPANYPVTPVAVKSPAGAYSNDDDDIPF